MDPSQIERPIFDHHVHLDPRGKQAEAVKAFERAGGTHLLLVHKPYSRTPPQDAEAHRAAMQTTLTLAEQAREATEVGIDVVAAPHPAELTQSLAAGASLEQAAEAYRAGLQVAGELVEAGKTVGLGEVGRPHYEVEAEIMDQANALFKEALALCADLDCPAVLHTEAGDSETFGQWARWADEAGLDRGKVVKHYSPPLLAEEENHGLVPSLLASRETLEEALSRSTRFFMETDYMDDPDRPGAVLGPKTVPRRTIKLHQAGLLDDAAWEQIHVGMPRQVYGIDTSL